MITTIEILKSEMETGAQTFEITGDLYADVKVVRSISAWKFAVMGNATVVILAAAGLVPIAAPALIIVAGALGSAFAAILGFRAAKIATRIAVGLGSMEKMKQLRSFRKVSDSNGVLVLAV